jgi:arylsulfate sulfotransferase
MKYLCAFKPLVLGALLAVCGLSLGCGTGLNTTPPPAVSVAATQNPLVAQYTVVSACLGQAMVEFGQDTSYGMNTAWYPVPGKYQKATILVAGMKASTTYHMRAQVQCFGNTLTTSDLTFTTGALPSAPAFPHLQISRPDPPAAAAAISENPGIELISLVAPTGSVMQAYFTDRDGNPIWYYPITTPGDFPFTMKLAPNGHMLISITQSVLGGSILREVDLAGNTVRELDISTLAQQIKNAGFDFAPAGYHHDLLPLDNGHLLVIVDVGKTFNSVAGYTGPINVIGDAIIDLDQNWKPVWAWNSFDYLDVNRHLNSTLLPKNTLDWTHSNALVYSANDGNLLLSMRHQSWVLKIDYQNGAGTGQVLWKLGYQGDFSLAQGSDPSLWFSFQHFPSVVSQNGSKTTLAVWDNGDNRVLNSDGEICAAFPGGLYPSCYSRATVFQLDESAMVANLLWTDSPGLPGAPGYYSLWGGSVNQLANGNIEFDLNAPIIPPAAGVGAEVQEVTQTSTPQIVWKMDIPNNAYRAYRVPSLYPGVTWP